MRDVLFHQYFGIDLDQVWDTVERDIPALKIAVGEMLASLDGNPSR